MEHHFQRLWPLAQPYLKTRSNDIHTRYCYQFARQLVTLHPATNPDIVLPAILLHDVGWSTVPDDKVLLSFGPNMQYPELRRQHEVEGVRIAREILTEVGYDSRLIDEIVKIIDGHDTRKESQSLNDSIVRDADKLWPFTAKGMQTVHVWFDYTPAQYLDMLDRWLETRFYTDAGCHMAYGLRAVLQMTTQEASV